MNRPSMHDPNDPRDHPEPGDTAGPANLSTEHQKPGDAKRPSDTLDRDQGPPADDGGRKSSLLHNA